MTDAPQIADWTDVEEEAAARIREVTPCTRLMSLHAARIAMAAERERCAKIAEVVAREHAPSTPARQAAATIFVRVRG